MSWTPRLRPLGLTLAPHASKKGISMQWLSVIAITGAVIAMLGGLWLVFARLKAKDQGFGPNSLRAIGIVLFVPGIMILAIATEFRTETLAALLGTVAGYVLSNSKTDDN